MRASARSISAPLAVPGVVYALGGIELAQILPPVSDTQLSLPKKWTTQVQHKFLNPQQPLLAHDKVRHVGEAVAVIVAESRYVAEDAAALVTLDLEPLPALIDAEAALATAAPVIHDRLKTNLIGEFTIAKGDVEAALARAPHRLKRRFYHHRYAAVPLECRGVVSDYDRRTDSVTIWSSTQVVHWVRREAAGVLGLPEARIRCIALDVGGGFGGKGHVYPEDLLVPFLARRLGRPVRWIEERREHFMSATHSRDQLHDVEIGFDDDGRILAIRDDYIVDCGAWNPIGSGVAYNTAVHLTGPYKIAHLAASGRIVATNKVPNAPYRGAGRPEATLAMERVMDLMAGELGLEPAEVRARNMIPAAEMPYRVGIPYRDGEPIVYDSGDYPGALQKALDAVGGVAAFRGRQAQARKAGRHLGLGIGCYVEGTGVGPFESATGAHRPVRQDLRLVGRLSARPGHGDDLRPDRRRCLEGHARRRRHGARRHRGDRDRLRHDREPQHRDAVGRDPLRQRAAARESLRHRRQHAGVRPGRPRAARWRRRRRRRAGRRGVARQGRARRRGRAGITAARRGWTPGSRRPITSSRRPSPGPMRRMRRSSRSTPRPGGVKIEQYAIAHDCGVVVNPMLVEGQVIGGAVQGIGGALLEEFHYDAEGQLVTVSLADYLLPTASDVPSLQLVHQHSPSPLNPLGVKGVGEGGAIAPPVAIANAVCDALAPFGIELNRTPVRPDHLVHAIRQASSAA